MSRSTGKRTNPDSPHSAAIALLQRQSLTTLVQRELERQIVSGEVRSGAKLNETDIASDLGVSRGPVREAFRALEQAGLVRTEKNRGVFVRQISLEEANEIYEVRAALEALIGRLAAQRILPEQVERIRAVVARMHDAARARDAAAYYPLNVEFHELLAEAAGNRALHANYRRLVNELDLYRRETLARAAEQIPASTRDHEAILNAVARHDAARAESLLVAHVLDSRERLQRTLRKSEASGGKPARRAA